MSTTEQERAIWPIYIGLVCILSYVCFAGILDHAVEVDDEAEVEAAARRYLAFVGLEDAGDDLADNLSYGDQRRLEIGRALATHPSLLLLDEPAAGMNPRETESLMQLIDKIRRAGVTVLLIEHDMKMVMRISDEVYVLDHGELIASGPPDEVRDNKKVIEAYLGTEED